jgi:hypothetical protein
MIVKTPDRLSLMHKVLPNRNFTSHIDAIFALVENGGRI